MTGFTEYHYLSRETMAEPGAITFRTKMTTSLHDPLMSVQEMADYLRVSKSSAYKIIKDLQLQIVFPTSDIRIRKSTIDAALTRTMGSDVRNSSRNV